jgi:hypothetical protein
MKIVVLSVGGCAESRDEQRFSVIGHRPIPLGSCPVRMFLNMVPGIRTNRSKRKDVRGAAGRGSVGAIQNGRNGNLGFCAIGPWVVNSNSDTILAGGLDTNHRELRLRRPTVIGLGVIFFPCSNERIVCRLNERTGESKEECPARASRAFCRAVHRQSRDDTTRSSSSVLP